VTNKPRVGVIGIGAMGLGVAKRLLQQGYRTYVRDIRPQAEQAATACGAIACATPQALARECDTLITLVLDASQTEAVLFGEAGVVEGMKPGGVVVMSSTISPRSATQFAERLQARGVLMLDAPVSGGPARALTGEMSMMVAGSAAAFNACAELLGALSGKLFRISDSPGDGSKMKIVNNMLAGINLVAASDGVALGMRLGLEARQMVEVISASSGASWVMVDRLARFLQDDYRPRAATTVLAKNLGIALETAGEQGVDIPLAAAAHRAFLDTIALGYGGEDDVSVIKRHLKNAMEGPALRREGEP
jgi:L-threonate 2-dehydrogenase